MIKAVAACMCIHRNLILYYDNYDFTTSSHFFLNNITAVHIGSIYKGAAHFHEVCAMYVYVYMYYRPCKVNV